MSTTLAPTKKQARKTYTDYLQAVDDNPGMRVELINGEIVMSPAPRPIHQIVSNNLTWLLDRYVRDKRLGRVLSAPVEVKLAEDQVPQPDLLFIRRDRLTELVGERSIIGAPDLIVEILSPGTARYDRHTKLMLYAHHNVAEYWIIDIEGEAVEVYVLDNQTYRVAGIFLKGDVINVGQFSAAQIAINDIFSL